MRRMKNYSEPCELLRDHKGCLLNSNYSDCNSEGTFGRVINCKCRVRMLCSIYLVIVFRVMRMTYCRFCAQGNVEHGCRYHNSNSFITIGYRH